MKVRKQFVALLLLTGVGAALVAWRLPFDELQQGSAHLAGAAPSTAGKLPSIKLGIAALPPRPEIGEARGDPFAPRQWAPETPAASAQPPAPPPMPYRYAGKVLVDGVEQVLLARGDVVVAVRAGETLEGGYRVESIDAEWISLQYLPLRMRQRIPVTSMLDTDVRR